MKFGPVAVNDAVGAVMAHSLRSGDVALRKGTVIGAAEVAALISAGIETIIVATIEPGDVPENQAAQQLADALKGDGVTAEAPFTGRSNLFATQAGVLVLDTEMIDAINSVDEALTFATLPALKAVQAGELIGTVKVIPFAVSTSVLAAAMAFACAPVMRVQPFRPKRVALISTLLPGLKTSVIDKTLSVTEGRLRSSGASLILERRITHSSEALSGALREVLALKPDIVVVFGASAIADRQDVIPVGLEAAGGRVEHLGMPVDPGNLLMIGTLAGTKVIGAPGCARSPRENGFDWVLQRLLADVPVTKRDIQRMGVGGLLMEIGSRPQPRAAAPEALATGVAEHVHNVGVIVLAAGRSTRMGGPNKLLALHEGRTLIRRAVENVVNARVGPVMVVTGHQREAIEQALAGLPVQFTHNPDYSAGLSSSLKAGILALPATISGALVVLGDMPLVPSSLINRLAQAYREHPAAKAVVPVTGAGRGNPVLVRRPLFEDIMRIEGDSGARRLLEAAGDDVLEVPVDDPAIHQDIDTPEALQAIGGRFQ